MVCSPELLGATQALCRALDRLRFGPPVTHVYNPLCYAAEPYADYLTKYGGAPKRVLLLGMNPGPFGMAQTGVPFGEVSMVRDWLRVGGRVSRPQIEHPKRPIEGFDCGRSEVSGARLWGAIQARFGTPARFFAEYFVANYCPLVFMEASGKNRTPDKLAAHAREALFAACDQHLLALARVLRPQWVIGIGKFAEARARAALAATDTQIGCILHPSPANPAANRGWGELAAAQLAALGISFQAP